MLTEGSLFVFLLGTGTRRGAPHLGRRPIQGQLTTRIGEHPKAENTEGEIGSPVPQQEVTSTMRISVRCRHADTPFVGNGWGAG